ncbi:MAG: dephospho-CoA kinase [Muribaculaceae bacterium]|nr:dephospho-CoA kinase [Muribaculaceae bacterium]
MRLFAISGGIGSGKSVVAHMLQVMGYQVYDCDSRAKSLMTESQDVRRQLIEAFGNETYLADGSLNRQHLSAVAFADEQSLKQLNAIVHPATARDMRLWADSRAAEGDQAAFVETALLRTAGIDRMVDGVWHVTAPEDVRIRRVMARNGLTAEQVRDRMVAQIAEEQITDGEQVIVNDDVTAILPQVLRLLAENS